MSKSSLLAFVLAVILLLPASLFAETIEEYYLKAAVLYFHEQDAGAALAALKKVLEIDPAHSQSLRLYRHIIKKFESPQEVYKEGVSEEIKKEIESARKKVGERKTEKVRR